jgi:hypothetical protein
VRLERLLDVVLALVIRELVDVRNTERLLDLRFADFGQKGRAVLLVKDEIAGVGAVVRLIAFNDFALLETRNDAVDLVVLVGRLLARARNDQRRARLVDQD